MTPAERLVRPVTLPPGRTRFATRPLRTGSLDSAKTIGMPVVRLAADGCRPSRIVTITSALSRAKFGRDLGELLAASLRPAILDDHVAPLGPPKLPQPLDEGGGPLLLHARRIRTEEKPMMRAFPDRCARAASGHTAAPPMSVMMSRRLMPDIGDLLSSLSLPQGRWQVLRADLNRSDWGVPERRDEPRQRMLELRPTCYDGDRRSVSVLASSLERNRECDPVEAREPRRFLVGALRGPIAIMEPSHHHITLQ
jgi:hypothetical protein